MFVYPKMRDATQRAQDLSVEVAKWLLTEFFAALPTALIYSMVLLMVAVGLIVICQKFKIYTRSPGVWNVLTKLHYPLLVISLMALGFSLGLIASLKKSSDKAVDEHLHPVISDMVAPLQEQIIERMPAELMDKPMTGQDIHNHFIEQAAKSAELAQSTGGSQGVMAKIGREVEVQVKAYLIKVLIQQAVSHAAEKVGMSEKNAEFSLELFKSMDFSQQADEVASKITGPLKTQLSSFAWSLRIQLLMYWATFLVLLTIDPLVYFLIWQPYQKKKEKTAADTPKVSPP